MGLGSKIRRLDVFKKIPEDLSEATSIGGLISLTTLALITFFLYSEIYAYMYPHLKASILLDNLVTRNEMTYFITPNLESTSTSSSPDSPVKSSPSTFKTLCSHITPTSVLTFHNLRFNQKVSTRRFRTTNRKH